MSSNPSMSPQTPDPHTQTELTLGLPLSFAAETLSPAAEGRVWLKMQARIQKAPRPLLWAAAASLAALILLNVVALNRFRELPDTDISMLAGTYDTGDFALYDQP